MLKQIIKINENDTNIKISLKSNNSLVGSQQIIDDLIQSNSSNIINPVVDGEKIRFKPVSNIINFYFRDNNGISADFSRLGYLSNEINVFNLKICNSFFIIDVFDSYDINNQNKLFTMYITKIINENIVPIYNLSEYNNQLYYWYIPQNLINNNSNLETITLYSKFYFFDAKNGGLVRQFYNNDYSTNTTPIRNYFRTELNFSNKTWRIITNNYPTVYAMEYSTATEYLNKISNNIDKITNVKQIFPTGSTFNYEGGNYI